MNHPLSKLRKGWKKREFTDVDFSEAMKAVKYSKGTHRRTARRILNGETEPSFPQCTELLEAYKYMVDKILPNKVDTK